VAQSTTLEAEEPEPAKQIEDAFQAITIADELEMPLEPEPIEEPVAEEPVEPADVEPADVAVDVTEESADAAEDEAPEEAEAAIEEPEAEPAEPAAEDDEEAAEDEDSGVDDTLTSAPALDLAEPAADVPAAATPEPADDAFTSQQKHFLIGKRVLRRIETPGGEVIAEEGESVTFDMIQKAKSSDQLLILSLNVE
jgi:hypothetical protein